MAMVQYIIQAKERMKETESETNEKLLRFARRKDVINQAKSLAQTLIKETSLLHSVK